MDDEKVDPNYTKGFNLGYWLNINDDGEKHYQELMEEQTSEKFRETSLYQGLIAGRNEAFVTRGKEPTHPILTGEQKKAIADNAQAEAESRERQAYKETTRKMKIEGAENSDFVEQSETREQYIERMEKEKRER